MGFRDLGAWAFGGAQLGKFGWRGVGAYTCLKGSFQWSLVVLGIRHDLGVRLGEWNVGLRITFLQALVARLRGLVR